MEFFFRADLLYLFQFCGNLFSALEYNAGERNVSLDLFRTSNYVRLPRNKRVRVSPVIWGAQTSQ